MTTTFAPQPGPATASDPTDVMGKRIGAWVIDTVLTLLIVGAALGLTGEYKQITDGFDGDEKEFCQQILDSNPDFEGDCISPPFGDRVYLFESGDKFVYGAAAGVWVIFNFIVLQGAVGATVGKLVLGLRVVSQQGRNAGIGRCLVRTLLWIVDILPGLPVVGGIVAMTSNGHRRVGDIAASTFVVGTGSVGYPVNTPAVAAPAGATAWGAQPQAAPQAWGQPPAPAQPAQPSWPQSSPESWQQPQAPQWEQPAAPDPTTVQEVQAIDPTMADAPAVAPPETEPTPAPEVAAEPEPEPEPEVATEPEPEPTPEPSFDPTATIAGAHAPWESPTAAPEPTAAQPAAEPQWDEARGTYIQWDANRGAWLQWDNATNAWTQI